MVLTKALVLFCLSVLLLFKDSQAAVVRNSIQERNEYILNDDVINDDVFGIVNGTKSDIKRHPYQAAIFLFGKFLYSGAILNQNHIVTVGIIPFFTEYVTVGVGHTLLSEMTDNDLIGVEKITVHPNYKFGLDYDISVLKLKMSVKFSKTVQPIDIPSTGIKTGESAVVSGWGNSDFKDLAPTDNIVELTQTVIAQRDCKEFYNSVILSTNSFCAHKSQTAAPSLYDLGDPLVHNNKLYGLYAGKFSVPFLCRNLNKCPSIYTDVVNFRDWINQNIG